MTGFIPKEKLTAYQRWELAAFDEEEAQAAEPEPELPPPEPEPEPPPPEPEPELPPVILPTAEDIERWYLERIFKLRELAFTKPEAYFYKFAFMPDEEISDYAHDVWSTVNLPNLIENIEPTRSRADIVLRKGSDHTISEVLLRKL